MQLMKYFVLCHFSYKTEFQCQFLKEFTVRTGLHLELFSVEDLANAEPSFRISVKSLTLTVGTTTS